MPTKPLILLGGEGHCKSVIDIGKYGKNQGGMHLLLMNR